MKNWKISARLGLGFAVLLLLQLTITAIGLGQMAHLSDQIRITNEIGMGKLYELNQVQFAIGERAIAARNLALVTDPALQKKDLDLVKSSQAEIDKGMERLSAIMKEAGAATVEERRMLDELKALEAKYLPIAGKVVSLATSARTEEAIKALTQECMPLLTQVIAHGAAFETDLKAGSYSNVGRAGSLWQRAVGDGADQRTVAAGRRRHRVFVTRSITRPLRQAVRVAQTVAVGRPDQPHRATTRDETGQLLDALKTMNDSLAEVVGEVRQRHRHHRHRVERRSPPATRTCRRAPSSRPARWRRPRPRWKS